jgi:mercuric ion transport protein
MRDVGGVLGLGAAACAACCAGPILALLGGVSILGFASTTVIGIAGVVVGLAALVAHLVVRRRRTATSCSVPEGPVQGRTPVREPVKVS